MTTGLNGQVIEWDLQKQAPKAKYNSHSAIWDSKLHGKYAYLASEDGSVKIVKVKKTKIEFVRALVKVEGRCLSVELESHKVDEKALVKSLYAGYDDSSIRRWDLATGNSALHFQKLTKQALRKAGPCLMWKLKLFKGRHLISGDSQGDVTVWDAEFGTISKQFKNLKGDINAIEVNEQFNSVYASGADSRVVVIQLKEDKHTGVTDWVFASIYRGQSHDVKSLVLLSPKQLLSAGVTTDLCLYNLISGRFTDQFGKDSKQQQMAPKLRHIPPFPFSRVALVDKDTSTLCMKNGSGRSVDVWSAATFSQLLSIEKKGDFNVACFDKLGSLIAYSDARDTQVFNFDQESLQIQKLTQKICLQNETPALPPASFVKLYRDEEKLKMLLVTLDLDILIIDLSTDYKITEVSNVDDLLSGESDVKLRKYDRVLQFAHFNPSSGHLFLSFLNTSHFLMVDTQGK